MNVYPTPKRLLYVLFLVLAVSATSFVPLRAQAQSLPVAVYEVSGRVIDFKENPVAGAEVSLFDTETQERIQTISADSGGLYKFSDVAAGTYEILANSPCCRPGSVVVKVEGLDPLISAPDVMLEPLPPVDSGDPVKLSGTVIDHKSSEPVGGVWLSIESYYTYESDEKCDPGVPCAMYMPSGAQYFEVQSNQSGSFEVTINRGSANVWAHLDGYDSTRGFLDMGQDRVVQVPMRKSELNLVRLHGVLRNDQGETVPGGWIYAGPSYDHEGCPPGPCARPVPMYDAPAGDGQWSFESYEQQYNSTNAGPDGSWAMFVASGRLQVQASAMDHIEASQVIDASGGGDREVKFVLVRIPPDTVHVTGAVLDRDDGSPIAYADVNFENQQWGTWHSARTDESGHFDVKVKPGYTIVTVSAYKFYYTPCESYGYGGEPAKGAPSDDAAAPMPTSVRPCEPGERDKDYLPAITSMNARADEAIELSFDLRSRAPPTSQFEGYVLNATSKDVVPGATVTFYNEETRDWGSAMTDEDGSYVIKVHAGYYTVRIWAQGYFDGVANLDVADEEVQRADFVLEPGQKRYGHWAYGGYGVMEASAGPYGPMPQRTAAPSGGGMKAGGPEGPPVPADGQQAYAGSAGGLGPYHESVKDVEERGGNSPSAGLVAALGALGAAMVAIRLRGRRN